MYGRMGGWGDGWMGRCMDGKMDQWVDGWIDCPPEVGYVMGGSISIESNQQRVAFCGNLVAAGPKSRGT